MRPRRSHVEITERSIVIDGKDLSHLVTDVRVLLGVNEIPRVVAQFQPYLVSLDLDDAAVLGYPPRPLDGIDRLRERVARWT